MSLPPVTLQIKRKATDEPVDFLQIHEPNGKRQQTAGFVFCRKPASLSIPPTATLTQAAQADRPIKKPHRTIVSTASSAKDTHGSSQSGTSWHIGQPDDKEGEVDPGASVPEEGEASLNQSHNAGQRRFHMVRNPLQKRLQPGKVRKRSASTNLTFTERKSRKMNTEVKKPSHHEQEPDNAKLSPENAVEPPRIQKKPGLNARRRVNETNDVKTPIPSSTPKLAPSAIASVRMPSGRTMPWDVNNEQLAAEMQAYTLQVINQNVEDAKKFPSGHDSRVDNPRKQVNSRFKPKKPALRYAERHPEQASAPNPADSMEVDYATSSDDMDDGAEYIIDTYIRMPADTLESSGNPKNFGLLVLDSQPDIDEFYLEEHDSDEEDEYEDEDENAENHYTADYPDDEVDSDDEFDRNAYNYHMSRDEFEDDDANFSGDESSNTKPWMKRPEDRIFGHVGDSDGSEEV